MQTIVALLAAFAFALLAIVSGNGEMCTNAGHGDQPHCHQNEAAEAATTAASQKKEEVPKPDEALRRSVFNPKLAPGARYQAKSSATARAHKLRKVCQSYWDPMLPEKVITTHVPPADSFMSNEGSNLVFCTISNVAKGSFRSLFFRMAGDTQKTNPDLRESSTFATVMKKARKVLMVRHPLERLLSVYIHNFGPSFNVTTNKSQPETMSFGDFVALLVDAPRQVAEHLDDSLAQGMSVGLDLGKVDGEGESRMWAPYWKQCGLCHPDFRPDLILHMDQADKDKRFLIEQMSGPASEGAKWADIRMENKAADVDVIRSYYSQLTKADVRALYSKYRIDHELFGYKPDYFVALAQ